MTTTNKMFYTNLAYLSVISIVIYFSEAHQLAKEFDCKYIETSAVLNHKVDELLVGILKQIQLTLNPEAIEKAVMLSQDKVKKHSSCKGPRQLLNKLLRKNSKPLSRCENLFDL